MLWDDVLKHPALRRAVAAGEERVGKAVVKLLGSEGVGEGLRTLAAGAAQARETFERGVSQALHAANLPSKDDVAALKRRIEELEAMIDGLADKVGRGPPRGGPGGGGGA
jgi:regulator of protease activity HflC (stomatin/prohibitin superfamily)